MARLGTGAGSSAVGESRLLLAPAWLWFLTFFLIPLSFMVVYSFGINTGFFTVRGWTRLS